MQFRFKAALIAGLIGCAWGSPAFCSEWWLVAGSKDSVFFIDRSSVGVVTVLGRSYLKSWELRSDSVAAPDKGKNAKDLNYWSCSDHTFTTKSAISYTASGDIVQSATTEDYQLKWTPIVPDSIGDSELAFVCNAKIGEGAVTEFKIDSQTYFYVDDIDRAVLLLTPAPPGLEKSTPTPIVPARPGSNGSNIPSSPTSKPSDTSKPKVPT